MVNPEDVADQALVEAWKRLATFDPVRSSFQTWLYVLTGNVALREVRLGERAARGSPVNVNKIAAPIELEPAAVFTDKYRAEVLWSSLRKLPRIERHAVILCDMEQRTNRYAARVLRISEAQVRRARRKGLERLRGLLLKHREYLRPESP
jgi:RNA polymerase sigma-70 factor (ECF subfamily)